MLKAQTPEQESERVLDKELDKNKGKDLNKNQDQSLIFEEEQEEPDEASIDLKSFDIPDFATILATRINSQKYLKQDENIAANHNAYPAQVAVAEDSEITSAISGLMFDTES